MVAIDVSPALGALLGRRSGSPKKCGKRFENNNSSARLAGTLAIKTYRFGMRGSWHFGRFCLYTQITPLDQLLR